MAKGKTLQQEDDELETEFHPKTILIVTMVAVCAIKLDCFFRLPRNNREAIGDGPIELRSRDKHNTATGKKLS
ncbi:hypothetical protein TNCV_2436141 [Trichonephila clavipes]|nr:hypothetical protein TNCV_2436141 [Trichonephila clavipes]